MEKFKEIIDTYISNYNTYKKGKITFECEYGELTFFKGNINILILHGIYIFPEFREKGLCRDTLCYMIDKSPSNFNQVCVQSVLSKILYEYLLRFSYKDKKFKCKKNGFIYNIN
jgi:hypothetical protein